MTCFASRVKKVVTLFAVVALAGLQAAPYAEAKPPFLSTFIARYATSANLFTCGTCHYDFNGPQDDDLVSGPAAAAEQGEALNPYGRAFAEAGGEEQPASALADIEGSDSDGDGTNNLVEIVTLPGFMPGYDCENYMRTANAPGNLAFFVDPSFVGCGVTTTSTVPATTTTVVEATTTTTPASTTTTSTLPAVGRCAQPRSDGPLPTASDCLFILRAALGSSSCDPECLCAPKGSLPVTATDALICLKRAIGQDIALQCPCSGVTTTTVEAPTTTLAGPTTTVETPTTTLPLPTSTTTSSTTTTTAGAGSSQAGQAIFDTRCTACHSAGAHDTNGFAGNLAGKSALLVNNLGSINSAMTGITLTDDEILDLAAFFDSL